VEEKTEEKDKEIAEELEEEKAEPAPIFMRFAGYSTENIKSEEPEPEPEEQQEKFVYPLQKYLRLKEEVIGLEKKLKELSDLAELNHEESTKGTIAQTRENLSRI